MLLEANFPLNFTKLWILLLVNLVVVSRMVSSNTQVASLTVPLYLLNPFTQHRKNAGTDCQYSQMHRDYVPSEITLKVSLWGLNPKKPAVWQIKPCTAPLASVELR